MDSPLLVVTPGVHNLTLRVTFDAGGTWVARGLTLLDTIPYGALPIRVLMDGALVLGLIDQAQPGWMRGFNTATILPTKQSCTYRLREYYALTGLSPRLERHYNVALGI